MILFQLVDLQEIEKKINNRRRLSALGDLSSKLWFSKSMILFSRLSLLFVKRQSLRYPWCLRKEIGLINIFENLFYLVEMISAPFLHQHWINILIKLWENSLELDNSLRVNTTDEDDGVEHDQSGLPHHLQQQWGLSLVEQTPGSSGYRFYENFRWTFLTWIMYVKEAQVLKASASFFIKIFIYINILLTCFQRIVYF